MTEPDAVGLQWGRDFWGGREGRQCSCEVLCGMGTGQSRAKGGEWGDQVLRYAVRTGLRCDYFVVNPDPSHVGWPPVPFPADSLTVSARLHVPPPPVGPRHLQRHGALQPGPVRGAGGGAGRRRRQRHLGGAAAGGAGGHGQGAGQGGEGLQGRRGKVLVNARK